MNDTDLLKFVFEYAGEFKAPIENDIVRLEIIDESGQVKTHNIKRDSDTELSDFEQFKIGLGKIAKTYQKD